jgi:copper(I)-binding protein
MLARLLFGALFALAFVSAQAHDFKVGDLQIDHPWARPTAGKQPTGGAYLSIENRGKAGDSLLRASSPIASEVQIHSMKMEGNTMRMREVGKLDVAAGAKVEMTPGDGYHIMLMGLKQPLKEGDRFPMKLEFEKAGAIDVTVNVERPKASAAPAATTHKH